jgi:hypothetical protein
MESSCWSVEVVTWSSALLLGLGLGVIGSLATGELLVSELPLSQNFSGAEAVRLSIEAGKE